jgi:hypothetical protein
MKIEVKVGLYGPGATALSGDPALSSAVDFSKTAVWFCAASAET